jgi:endonuclease YncB( thermonuclease family)
MMAGISFRIPAMSRLIPLLLPIAFLGLGVGLPTRHHQPEPVADLSLRLAMPLCGTGRRVTCVVDGDTFWLRGEKIRIANIDAPEVRGRCRFEREQARRATLRLAALLTDEDLSLKRQGRDRHGRSLVVVHAGSRDVGHALVAENLAREWRGHMEVWCG